MTINFCDLKNNFYKVAYGSLACLGGFSIGYSIYQAGVMEFSAKLIKDSALLGLAAFATMYVVRDIFSSLGGSNDSFKYDLAALSISVISIFSLASAAAFGYRVPAYLLTSFLASIAAGGLLFGSKQLVKGIVGLHNLLTKDSQIAGIK